MYILKLAKQIITEARRRQVAAGDYVDLDEYHNQAQQDPAYIRGYRYRQEAEPEGWAAMWAANNLDQKAWEPCWILMIPGNSFLLSHQNRMTTAPSKRLDGLKGPCTRFEVKHM